MNKFNFKNLTHIKSLLYVIISIAGIYFLYLSFIFITSKDLVENERNWDDFLNNSAYSRKIVCENGTYMLWVDDSNGNNIGASYIGESAVNLDEYCNRNVTTNSQIIPQRTNPLCNKNQRKTCDIKVPAISILNIEIIKK